VSICVCPLFRAWVPESGAANCCFQKETARFALIGAGKVCLALGGLAGEFQTPGGGPSKEGPAGELSPRQLATYAKGPCNVIWWASPNQRHPARQLPSPQLSQLSRDVADGPTIIFKTPLSAKVHPPPPPGSPPLTLVTPQLSCPFSNLLFQSTPLPVGAPPPAPGHTHKTAPYRFAIPPLPDRRPTQERPQPALQPCPTRVIGMRQLLLHVRGGGPDMGENCHLPRPAPAPGAAMPRRRPSSCDTSI